MNIINLLLVCLPFGAAARSRRQTGANRRKRASSPLRLEQLEDRTVLSPMFRYPLDPGVSQSSVTDFDDNPTAGHPSDAGTKHARHANATPANPATTTKMPPTAMTIGACRFRGGLTLLAARVCTSGMLQVLLSAPG